MSPLSWQEIPIRYLGRVFAGSDPKSDSKAWGGDIPFATPVDLRVSNGGVLRSTERSISYDGAVSESTLAPNGSVIVSVRAPIGYISIATKDTALSRGCCAVLPTGSRIESEFLAYSLLANQDLLGSYGNGSTFKGISSETIKSIKLLVPSVAAQRRIARFLDEETAKIDRLIETQRLLRDLYSERIKVVCNQIIDDVDGNMVRLGRVFARTAARATGSEEVLSVYRDFGVIPKESRTDNHNVTPLDVTNYRVVQVGDLVINKMKAWQGSLGISNFDGIVSGDYEVLHRIDERFSLEYLNVFLRSRRMISQYAIRSKGVRPSQWRLYWEEFKEIELPLIPLRQQMETVSKVSAADADRRIIDQCDRTIALLQERRSALITAAVTGQIEV